MYILTNLRFPLKRYVIRWHNLISMNISFTTKDHCFFITVKRQPKTNGLQKQKNNQKQPFPDVFQNRCLQKFPSIHRKTPALESLFNKLAGLKVFNFIKKRLQTQVFSCKYYDIFKNSFFIEHLRKTRKKGLAGKNFG